MEEIIRSLYYIVEEQAGQQYEENEEAKALLERRSELKEEIALRLGADGQDLMDRLSDLSLSLEDIHDEALFRAALRLGARLTRPRRRARTAKTVST